MGSIDAQIAQALSWLGGSAVVALLVLAFNYKLERKKLIRAERLKSYAEFLAEDSRRWGYFSDRDRLRKSGSAIPDQLTVDIKNTRDKMWAAYCHAQLAGSPEVVRALFDCLKISDARQRAYHGQGASPAADARAAALRTAVTAARKDLALEELPRELFS